MQLTEQTYFSRKANETYWNVSQFKAFMDCQEAAMAELKGSYKKTSTDAQLLGLYVDSHFSNTMPEFLEEHPEILNSRTGELKAAFLKGRTAIERAEADDMFMEYMSGINQKIMTGELFGEQWKIKIDSLHDDKIVDLKYMRSMDKVYKNGVYMTFIDAWGYDLQGFVYQQVVKAQTGKELPFYLAVITKDDHPDLALIHIPQWKLNSAGELIKHYLPEFSAVKRGKIVARRCEKCDWCKDTKKLTAVIEYENLLDEGGAE